MIVLVLATALRCWSGSSRAAGPRHASSRWRHHTFVNIWRKSVRTI